MHYKIILLAMIMLLTIIGASPSFASDEEVNGTVRQMSGSYISIVTRQGYLREFQITRKTTIFVKGIPSPIKRLLRNSVVQIMAKDGKAEAIFLQEAPK